MDPEVKNIIAFVQSKREKGAQYGEIRNHFHWSQTKWSKHWKEAREFLVKRKLSTGGYSRYWVKKHHREAAEKFLFGDEISSALSKGELHEVKISRERINKIKDEILDNIFISLVREAHNKLDMDKIKEQAKEIREKLKKEKTPKQERELLHGRLYFLSLFSKVSELKKPYENSLDILSKLIEVRVITEKGESTPILSDEQIKQLFLTAVSNLSDPNKNRPRRSLHIVVSYKLPKENA